MLLLVFEDLAKTPLFETLSVGVSSFALIVASGLFLGISLGLIGVDAFAGVLTKAIRWMHSIVVLTIVCSTYFQVLRPWTAWDVDRSPFKT